MRSRARVQLLAADVLRAVQDLPLEIGEIDDVAIDQADAADAGRGEIERDRRAEPAGADAEDARGLQPLLPLERDLRHDEMPRVTGDLVVAEFDALEAARIDDAAGHKFGTRSLARVRALERTAAQ